MQKTYRKITAFLEQCISRLLAGANRISAEKMTVGAAVLFVLSVLPILVLGRYSVMCIDDYNYGVRIHDTWMATGSFVQSVQTAIKQTGQVYQSWQGTYASCLLMALCPMNFSYHIAFIVPVIMIGVFTLSVFLVGRQLLVHWLGCEKKWVSFVLFLLLFMFYQVMEAPFEGIYWYNGAVHYIFMESILFFMLTLVSGCIWSEKKGRAAFWTLLASLLAVVAGGGNLVTGLQAEILLFMLLLYTFVMKKKKTVYVLLPFLFFTAGFLCNVLAPGNGLRAAFDKDTGYSAITAVILSFYYAVVFILRWTESFVILMWAALLPVFWKIAKHASCRFRHPVWVTLGIFCILSAMFTPTLYALGTVGLARVDNIIQMFYYLALFLLTIYWFGWRIHRESVSGATGDDERKISGKGLFGAFLESTGNILTMSVLLLVLILWVMTGDKNTYTGVSALRSLVNGDAGTYYTEAMERYAVYVDESVRDVVLEPFSAKPALFSFEDLTDDSGYWLNLAVADYYHKDSVRLRE